ncbi:MAG TPA: aconitate hydratase AcnA [Anaerolineae bacterium]
MPGLNSFGAAAEFDGQIIYRLERLAAAGVAPGLDRLPYSIRILLESLLRHEDGRVVTAEDVRRLAAWQADAPASAVRELPFIPARVVMQDFTGVPCVADLAALRDAMARLGHDPDRINPLVPVDLVIDHTLIVDEYGSPAAARRNNELGYARNRERYQFLRWGSQAFRDLRVIPPGQGIVHQVNLEYLSQGVITRDGLLFPDTVIGTDSHTPMVNGLSVLGWGVGGIEAEAVMLGQPLYLLTPRVVGVRLSGRLAPGVTATDLVLTVTQMLRREGVVDKFVEFCGPGLASISLPDRATIANMAPDYGATVGFFPTDDETLRYLRQTGRAEQAARLGRYARTQGLFRGPDTADPTFTKLLTLDLGTVEASLAGPKKPEERVALASVKVRLADALTKPVTEGGFGLAPAAAGASMPLARDPKTALGHGSVVLAAITSCTNTSNPALMIAAGLLARNAVRAGLAVKRHVKTALAPGSQVVTRYLDAAGLTPYLEQLGFYLTGYGCMVCVGNSGPLPDDVAAAIGEGNLVAAGVLSGNRNFEGRIHPLIRANFLASPPLVVAFALAGTVAVDLTREPLGRSADGQPVYLADIWPAEDEVAATLAAAVDPAMFQSVYDQILDGDDLWQTITVAGGRAFAWDPASTYVRRPPFFDGVRGNAAPAAPAEIHGARALALFGDGITTDHISPVGSIAKGSPAAAYLQAQGVAPADFNTYGTRRGNHEVMLRGTFANIRLKNLLLRGEEGGNTRHWPDGGKQTIFDAAMAYAAEGVSLVVVAGAEYGTGSSRDWAAKGTALLGVAAVIAVSFERIHRANLAGMGVLPLQFRPGERAETLGLTGRETFDVLGLGALVTPRQELTVVAHTDDGRTITFPVTARLDTAVEVEYYRHGGILPAVLRQLMRR